MTEVTTVDVRRILPALRNPNKMEASVLAGLASAIDKFGFDQPVVVRPFAPTEVGAERPGWDGDVVTVQQGDMEMVDGHHRYRAVSELGWEEVPAIVKPLDTHMAEVQRVSINQHRGETDLAVVADIFTDLAEHIPLDTLTLTGFSEDEIRDLVRSTNETAEDVMEGWTETVQQPVVEDEEESEDPSLFALEIRFSTRANLRKVRDRLKEIAGDDFETAILRLVDGE